MLPLLLDLRYPLHRLDRGLHQLAVVADGDVSPLLELNGRVLVAVLNAARIVGEVKGDLQWSSPSQQPSGTPSSSVPSSGYASSCRFHQTPVLAYGAIQPYLKFLLHLRKAHCQ